MTLLTKLERELRHHALPAGPAADARVDAAALDRLPAPARRYLGFMRVEAHPRVWSFRVGWDGRFRTRPDMRWMRCEAWQYNTRVELARVFLIRVRMFGLAPVVARDTFVRGSGRMLVRLLDRLTVEDAQGRELDLGELVTYLNDALLLCPSMLLDDAVAWTHVDDDSFDVTLRHGALQVTGRAFIDARGALTDFSTEDRFCVPPARPKAGFVRTRWSTPVEGWTLHDGRPLPTVGRAVWHLPEGDFTYAELVPRHETLAINVAP